MVRHRCDWPHTARYARVQSSICRVVSQDAGPGACGDRHGLQVAIIKFFDREKAFRPVGGRAYTAHSVTADCVSFY
jgi:hypothetical protein